MRMLVGVLRQEREPAAELGPAPGLRDVSALVQQIGEAGVRVEVHIEGEPHRLPAGIDVSAYRIIQEALTNVVRHAGPAAAELWVRYHHEEIEIEIRDDGGRRQPDRAAALVAAEGGGHGLVGMRERAALFGGDFVAGPAGDGYRVLARLPTDEPEE
jgi:signal transduction histidine kinase